MAINDTLSALAQKLGLKTTRLQELQVLYEKLTDDIRRNQDRLSELKTEASELDAKLRAKKKEYDAADSSIREIIKQGDFVMLFKEKDQARERLASISGRLEKDVTIRHKLKLLIDAIRNPPNTDVSDEIRDELGDALSDLQEEDDSVKDLDAVSYSSREAVSDERIASIGTGESSDGSESSESLFAKEPQDELERMIAAIN